MSLGLGTALHQLESSLLEERETEVVRWSPAMLVSAGLCCPKTLNLTIVEDQDAGRRCEPCRADRDAANDFITAPAAECAVPGT
jgi:hypothetical protein